MIMCDKHLSVYRTVLLTMIDGKARNTITSTASAETCHIRRVTTKQINQIKRVCVKDVDITTFQTRLSALHTWSFSECPLHVPHRLHQKLRSVVLKIAVNYDEEKIIQSKFGIETCLLAHKVKQAEIRTSSEDRRARCFFENPALSSKQMT